MKNFFEPHIQNLKNLIPQGRQSRSLGLDIGATGIKLIEIEKKDAVLQIVNWKVEPYGPDEKSQSLKALLSNLNLSSPIVSAISGKGTLIRYVDLPSMSPSEARQSFLLEIDKYFPFPQDQIYVDCFIVDNRRSDKKMTVLVAAAKKDLIDQKVQIFTELGISIKALTLNSVAIDNVFYFFPSVEKKDKEQDSPQEGSFAYAVLDIGESVSSLNILVNQTPVFTRDIFVGGGEMTRSVSNSLGISLAEAEKLKCSPGEKLSEVSSATESVLNHLISEVRLSFDYFATEKNAHVSKIFLTGGASLFVGVTEAFVHQFDIPVHRWKISEVVKIAEGLDVVEIDKNSGQLAVALGLALMG
ncbi:MAG: type IV pilus assembly protein PilM [Candidatus Omnitrophica bacterium]|nr:type IV pilus assembly protein PilM [Candidatus Omnitrophota bacterium]